MCAAFSTGCSERSKPRQAIAKPASKTFKVVGVVRALNKKTGTITIRHEDIPGYMKKMTMPFDVADRSELSDVEIGDKVEATLRLEGESSRLTNLVVTEFRRRRRCRSTFRTEKFGSPRNRDCSRRRRSARLRVDDARRQDASTLGI